MYDNIGSKIKSLANGVFIFEAIAAVIGGIVLLVDEFIGLGLLTMFGGPVVAWVSSWLLYGFGELICETSQAKKELININRNIKIIAEPMIAQKEEADRQARKKASEKSKREAEEKAKHEAAERAKRAVFAREMANIEYLDITCPNCHEKLSFEKGTSEAQCPFCDFEFNIFNIDE